MFQQLRNPPRSFLAEFTHHQPPKSPSIVTRLFSKRNITKTGMHLLSPYLLLHVHLISSVINDIFLQDHLHLKLHPLRPRCYQQPPSPVSSQDHLHLKHHPLRHLQDPMLHGLQSVPPNMSCDQRMLQQLHEANWPSITYQRHITCAFNAPWTR